MVLAAELADWPYDDTRFMGNALALLVGGLPVWRLDGGQVSLAPRLADVDQVMWKKDGGGLWPQTITKISIWTNLGTKTTGKRSRL